MEIKNWEHFEKIIEETFSRARQFRGQNFSYVSAPLFRGQSDARWILETTLDRHQKNSPVKEYYNIIRRVKSTIESCTLNRWELQDIEQDLTELDNHHRLSMPTYEFMTYLRHNRFPSPLLDWTRSPYIAAFFAYNEDRKTEPTLYVYIEYTGRGKGWSSDKARICTMGKGVTTHKRHHLQQSEYTFCVVGTDRNYSYAPHEDVFPSLNRDQDFLEKYTLPISKRAAFLNKLNLMNINAYSLFENEEGLMRKLANEELLFKNF